MTLLSPTPDLDSAFDQLLAKQEQLSRDYVQAAATLELAMALDQQLTRECAKARAELELARVAVKQIEEMI